MAVENGVQFQSKMLTGHQIIADCSSRFVDKYAVGNADSHGQDMGVEEYVKFVAREATLRAI